MNQAAAAALVAIDADVVDAAADAVASASVEDFAEASSNLLVTSLKREQKDFSFGSLFLL